MHSQIMPPKLALNSCCSLKSNAFILCIHTRTGCLGDTQCKCKSIRDGNVWGNDDNGNVERWGWIAELVCNEEREHKKQVAGWVRGDETLLQYIQILLRPSASKGTKHKNTANMHRQWKLTVNSQNRVAMTQPQYRTQTRDIFNSQSSGEELNTSHLLQHTQTRTVASDVTVQTPMRTDRKKRAHSTHSR